MFEAGLFLRAVFSKRRQHTLLHRNWAKARFPGHTNDDNEATKYEIPIQHTNTKTNTNYKRNKKAVNKHVSTGTRPMLSFLVLPNMMMRHENIK